MESMESCVPPGFRFHPRDEELVGYYLRKKVASQKIDLDVIRDIDLYRIEPWDLQDKCKIGYEDQNDWYFFSHKDKKYPTGTRTNRATIAGFWKATGRDKAVYDKSKLIGMRKTLVFYKGRAPNGQKSDWIMHEYRLQSDENGPPQEEGWVVCRAFKKRTTGQSKAVETWETSYFYDEPSSSSVVDPIDHYITRQQPQNICKQELESENIKNLINSDDPFGQLPELESPSMTLVKRQSSIIPLLSESTDQEDERLRSVGSCSGSKKVTDWRALDKFVASQLSHGDHGFEGDAVSGFDYTTTTDMGFLLMESGSEEGSKFMSEFLSSSSDCDIGICVFDK